MITQKEMIKIARKIGIHAEIVERDYLISMIVDGFHQVIPKDFAFHGGSCRNKAYNGYPGTYDDAEVKEYFSTNRFSSDIDAWFNPKFGKVEDIKEIIANVAKVVSDKFEVPFLLDELKIKEKFVSLAHPIPNPRYDVYLPYRGPMSEKGAKFGSTKMKITLGTYEAPILPTTTQLLYHPYSDRADRVLIGNCFSYPELFANKLSALYNRKRAKDLYDVVILNQKYDITSYQQDVLTVLKEKEARWYKSFPKTVKELDELKSAVRENWDLEMPKIIHQVPDFDKTWQSMGGIFKSLNGIKETSLTPLPPSRLLQEGR